MGISAVYGLPGKNKTHFALYYAIWLSNLYEKPLVTNFVLDPIALARYCKLMNYDWLLANINNGKTVYYISLDDSLESLLSIPNSVVVCDEGAIYFPSRGSTYNTPKKVLADLCQVRHKSQYLIIIAQSQNQIDNAIRALLEEVFWCNGVSVWSKKLKNQRLVYKVVRRFTTDNFEQFLANPKVRKNPLKLKFLSNKSWTGVLTAADFYLFKIYNSFNQIESEKLSNPSRWLSYSSASQKDIKLIFPPPKNLPKASPPSLSGYHPFKIHKRSSFVSFLFRSLPSNFLSLVLKVDTFLSRLSSLSFNFNRHEKAIIAGVSFYFLALIAGFIF